MQIASTPSFLNTIGQAFNPVQEVKPLKSEAQGSNPRRETFLANASDKPAQSQATAPQSTSTRRGSTVNLLV